MTKLDPENFELEDISDDLSASGAITDEAIDYTSRRKQTSVGFNSQITPTEDLFAQGNLLILGFSCFDGKSDFDASIEPGEKKRNKCLSAMTPVTLMPHPQHK